MSPDPNAQIRAAAGLAIQQMIRDKGDNVFTWAEIRRGFEVGGKKILFANQTLGIFKPKELTDGAALSIKQSKPSRSGREAQYADGEVEDGALDYCLQKQGEAHFSNGQLLEAHKKQTPLIYFQGIEDSLYEVFYPVFVEDFSYQLNLARVVLDQPVSAVTGVNEAAAPYTASPIRERPQRAFRQRVLMAYGLRCALTNLPLVDLLEAVRIVRHPERGQASVQNGIAMSSLHRTAYESDLMGIDPDGKIILSEQVRGMRDDGPLFSQGLLGMEGRRMRFPAYAGHHPNRDFLAQKFEQFTKAGR